MALTRQTYRGRATKWTNLNRFYEIKRDVWSDIRKRQRDMLVNKAFSPQAYKFTHNLETCEGWKWIVSRLEKASTKPNPVTYLNQINIYKLEMCMTEIESELKRIQEYTLEQEKLPLAETDGYKYNQQYCISVGELQELAAQEFGTDFESE